MASFCKTLRTILDINDFEYVHLERNVIIERDCYLNTVRTTFWKSRNALACRVLSVVLDKEGTQFTRTNGNDVLPSLCLSS